MNEFIIPGASNADSNAALLFENLKYSNYVSKDRTSRLARDEVKATLKVFSILFLIPKFSPIHH